MMSTDAEVGETNKRKLWKPKTILELLILLLGVLKGICVDLISKVFLYFKCKYELKFEKKKKL